MNKEKLRVEFFKEFGYWVKSSRAMTTAASHDMTEWWLNKMEEERTAMIQEVEEMKRVETWTENAAPVVSKENIAYNAALTDVINKMKQG